MSTLEELEEREKMTDLDAREQRLDTIIINFQEPYTDGKDYERKVIAYLKRQGVDVVSLLNSDLDMHSGVDCWVEGVLCDITSSFTRKVQQMQEQIGYAKLTEAFLLPQNLSRGFTLREVLRLGKETHSKSRMYVRGQYTP